MPVTHRIDERIRVITMTLSMPITLEDLLTDYQKIFEDKQFMHNMNAVWDISGLDLRQVPVDEIRRLPRQMKQFVERGGHGYKAALVSTRPLDFHLLRAYVTILRLLGNVRFHVFRSMEEAYAWASDGK